MPDEITIELPLPNEITQPNKRAHFMRKSQAVKLQRTDAHLAAIDAMHALPTRPSWRKVSIQATLYRPDSNARAMDATNIIGWLKSTEDGIEDSGLIANDRGVTWEPPVQVLGKAAGGQRKLVLIVRKIA